MEEPIRQRLIGAIVLVALGVIFIPMLFDSPNEGWLSRQHPLIPPPPPLAAADHPPPLSMKLPPAAPAPAPAPSAATAPSSPSGQTAAPAPGAPAPAPSAAMSTADDRLAAWVVQVGSFTSADNAVSLRDRLRAKGFAAFIDKSAENGKAIARVQIGPEIDQAHAKALQERLLKEQKLHGIVVRRR